jgi:hypothetical protein
VDKIPDNTGSQSNGEVRPDPQHFKTTYRFTCHEGEAGEVFWTVWIESDDPTGIQRYSPIKFSEHSSTVEFLENGTFKIICLPDSIVCSKLRSQE